MSIADRMVSRILRLPAARNAYTAERGVPIPMRDGVTLRADHYAPVTANPRGTVLVRTPYGRGFPESALHGRTLAARGYHVVIASVRGTFGSGGEFEPMAQETSDGRDTISWLREREWFDGRLATLGGSYLGWAQWTLLQDPPPELRTAMIHVGPHDFREAVFGTGAFTLGDFLSWSSGIVGQEAKGLRRLRAMATARRRLEPGLHGLPLADAAEPVLRGQAPWYREWLSHPEGDDPFWGPYRAERALERVRVPVLLVSGWQDLFLDQTLVQYETLRRRGVEVSLTIGPWTHFGTATKGAGLVESRGLAWLDKHLAGTDRADDAHTAHRANPLPQGDTTRPSEAAVLVYRTGERKWHDMPAWPPATTPTRFSLTAGGALIPAAPGADPAADHPDSRQPGASDHPGPHSGQPSASDHPGPHSRQPGASDRPSPHSGHSGPAGVASPAAAAEAGTAVDPIDNRVGAGSAEVSFRYEPADPTPSVGGRVLSGTSGVRDNRRLEARPDVLTFTTAPLAADLDVAGSPVVELALSVDNPYADVFLRLCDVDGRGRSHNFSDLLRRLDPSVPAGQVQHLRLTLDGCFHRLAAGHRLRLQVSGGAHPRYARNLGTDGAPVDGSKLAPSVHTLHCAWSRIVLPTSSDAPSTTR
jgi:putative CocE/NonD family hydrolase